MSPLSKKNFFRAWILVVSGLFLCLGGAGAAERALELSLQSNVQQAGEPLTTEKVWYLDPNELNPHRTRWLLARHLELSGLRAVRSKDGFVPVVDSLYSKSTEYLRAETDPAWSEIGSFPCAKTPNDRFATRAGAQIAMAKAAKLWDVLLDREIFKLSVMLRHVHGEFGENAVRDSNAILAKWSDRLDREYRDNILRQARLEEWKYYEAQAKAKHLCGASAGVKRIKSWHELMEKPEYSNGVAPKLLARAPAKRWGGLFSILVTLKIGGKELVGKFLIDSSASASIISPTFLDNQGAQASWIQLPGAAPVHVRWSGGDGLADPAYVGDVEVGGMAIPVHRFYLHDTDYFGPPESFGSCCDGILGSDFLRQYAVEFRPGKTAEVNLYDRSGFHPADKIPWIEASFTSRDEIVSSCTAEARSTEHAFVHGQLKWDTGSEDALNFDKSTPMAGKTNLWWRLNCGPTLIGENIQIAPKEQGMTDTATLAAGMDLMSRDQFFMDLGHGRIWFNPNGLALPIVQDHSGLDLEFTFVDGERVLKVIGIRGKSAAHALAKAGLRVGMTILSLDSKSVDEMDTWEVEQRLSGVYGRTVSVEWKTGKKSSKMAPIELPPISP